MQRYEVGVMHVYCPVLWLIAVLSVPSILQLANACTQTGAPVTWVISALHPDPTPALGAPEAEYIALHALPVGPAGPDTISTEGLVLSWKGNRENGHGEGWMHMAFPFR